MKINIIYGTESGGGELSAEDIAAALNDQHEVAVTNMSDVRVGDLDTSSLYLVICSTYGEGELPFSAQPFHAELSKARPDLSGLHYAMFGRGDTAYLKTYSRGGDIISALLADLGATRIGEFGRHDAGDWSVDDSLAIDWGLAAVKVYEEQQMGAVA
jgi:MioC protein